MIYFIAEEIAKKAHEVQIAKFLNIAGKEIQDLFFEKKDEIVPTGVTSVRYTNNQGETVEQSNPTETLADVLKVIDEHFVVFKNTTQNRNNFLNARQRKRDVDVFILDLQKKAKQCEFCVKCRDSLVKDMIIIGVDCDSTRHKLLDIPNLDLPKAVAMVRNRSGNKVICSELAAAGANVASSVPQTSMEIDYLRKSNNHNVRGYSNAPRGGRTRGFPRGNYRGGRAPVSSIKCAKGCFVHPEGRCLATDVTCYSCGRRGHYSSACPTVHALEISEKSNNSEDNSTELHELFISALDMVDLQIMHINSAKSEQDTWWQEIEIIDGETSLKMITKLDSGAQVNIIPEDYYGQLKTKPKLFTSPQNVRTYSGHYLDVIGKCELEVGVAGIRCKCFFCGKNKCTSHHWLESLSCAKSDYESPKSKSDAALSEQHKGRRDTDRIQNGV
jgi:hypothetical protein